MSKIQELMWLISLPEVGRYERATYIRKLHKLKMSWYWRETWSKY